MVREASADRAPESPADRAPAPHGPDPRGSLDQAVDGDPVALLRRFNRTVTERVGLLDDSFLGRDRPLGASRLLWEIGDDGADLQALRTRLGLDSGYVSRLVRRLEEQRLLTIEEDPADRRRRRLRWTTAGRAEVRELDRRSDDAAAALLAQVPAAQRPGVLAAVAEVERALRATLVDIAAERPDHPDVVACFARYTAELDARFPGGFDPAFSISADPHELAPPAGVCVVARLRGTPMGCGAIKLRGDAPAELKRMWVDPGTRGLGVGRRLLERLEAVARDHGVTVLHLETNRALREAIALYRSAGFTEVAAFNDEPYAHHWFEKRLI